MSPRFTALAASLVAFLSAAVPAQAAFPGSNGKIAFTSDRDGLNLEVYAMSPDGSAQVNLTNHADSDSEPSWSPNGQKIAFTSFRDGNDEIYVMNPNGTGQSRITSNNASDTAPAWAPSGQKIAFTSDRAGALNLDIFVMNADGTSQTPLTSHSAIDTGAAWAPSGQKIAFTSTRDGDSEIFVMNADGTGQGALTSNTSTDSGPDWSPNGQKIVFSSSRDGNAEIYVMNADGSSQTRLTNNSSSDFSPVWSPDGQKIAFRSRRDGNWEIYSMNADGSSQTRLTTPPELDTDPDWQPVSTAGYARPKSATPVQAPLVPAYGPCASPNRTHGPPLDHPSCTPPVPRSGFLTIGTPDSNGAAANSTGSVQARVVPGNPGTPADEADVRLILSVTDVRRKSDLGDYTGELQASLGLRITDRNNSGVPGGGTEAGTTSDLTFTFAIPCVSTSSNTIGASCSGSTTADAVLPGAVPESKRTLWAMKQIEVFDGGADGVASTTPNTLFAIQGIFVP